VETVVPDCHNLHMVKLDHAFSNRGGIPCGSTRPLKNTGQRLAPDLSKVNNFTLSSPYLLGSNNITSQLQNKAYQDKAQIVFPSG